MLLVKGTSETGIFKNLSNHVLGVRNFGTIKALRVIFFFKIFNIESRFQKMQQEAEKIFFICEIISSSLESLNCP